MGIAASSLDYVNVAIATTPASLSGTPPQCAFLPDTNLANPISGDWLAGEWGRRHCAHPRRPLRRRDSVQP
ncbi:hypothetical protein ACIPUC_14400 [Streptomyces sp. LARHCF249]